MALKDIRGVPVSYGDQKAIDAMEDAHICAMSFYGDAIGRIDKVLKEHPEAVAVCSETTARQLMGFGITNNVLIKKPNEIFAGDDFEFQAISYPAEMHMWEGLLFFEKKRGIFFSSDLMFGMGENHGQVIESSWDAAAVAGTKKQWRQEVEMERPGIVAIDRFNGTNSAGMIFDAIERRVKSA